MTATAILFYFVGFVSGFLAGLAIVIVRLMPSPTERRRKQEERWINQIEEYLAERSGDA